MTYICDIDGTLADHKGIRSPYDESKVLLDKPLPTCEIIDTLIQGGHTIIFFSGRTDKCYSDTIAWLRKYVTDSPVLHMRKAGDSRPDTIIKKEMYIEYILSKGIEIAAVFDDRLSVVRMWEGLGLFVLNCNQGNIEF